MKISGIRVYRGRNIYSHNPCIKADINLEEYFDTPTCDIPNFNNLLLEFIPTLREHKCSRGYKGGFVERLYEGTYMGHVIEHVTIEIQNLLGYDIAFGKARKTNKENIYSVIYEYKNEIVAIEALHIAISLINDLCRGVKDINFNQRLKKLKDRVIKLDLGPSTLAIKQEAEKRGIPVLRLGSGSLLQLGYGKHSKRIQATITENTKCIPVDIVSDKSLTKDILSTFGIPVPEGYVSCELEYILEYADELGYPVVIKPNNGNQGKGVSLNLKNKEEVTMAYKIAKNYGSEVLIEKFVEGKHYRILVVDDKVVAGAERIAAHVIGNGKNTVRELIEEENKNPLRGEGHEKPLTKIKIDSVMELLLRKNNMTLDYIPKKGEVVFLRENDNLSTGGIAVDITDEIHPENIQICINVARILGLDIAGVDITTRDIREPITQNNGAVIEVNAAPGIRMHHYPTKGKQRNVAKAIIDMLFPEGSQYNVPIVSVTGTNGKTTTVRMISKILREKGYNVGMTSTSGIYLNDECLMKGDNTGPLSAQSVLMDKRVEAAVLETARGGLVNRGLGYDLADVGVVTNITEDHLGVDDINTLEDMAYVKSLVVEAVKKNGYAVLNADDNYCVKIGEDLKVKIIFFSTSDNNILVKKHLRDGGKAVYLKNKYIIIHDGDKENQLMEISEIPATLNGKLTYNIKNSLAAVAAAYGLGIELSYIVEGLKKFKGDEESNPGRFNVHHIRNFKVIVDYGHNIDGYNEVINTLKRIKHNRLIGVIGVPGDRTDTSTVKIGQLCGANFDYIFIKEDKDLRGRKPGEVARFLKNGCQIGGIDKDKIEIELSEEKALKKAMMMAQKDDIVVVFYEDYEGILKTIKEFQKISSNEINVVKENA